MIFVTIMTSNTPIPKVIRSVLDSFMERSAPNVNGLLNESALLLKRNLVITLLESRLGFFCQTKTNMEHIYPVWCEQLNFRPVRFGSISLSNVHIGWIDFRSGLKIDPVWCEHSLSISKMIHSNALHSNLFKIVTVKGSNRHLTNGNFPRFAKF